MSTAASPEPATSEAAATNGAPFELISTVRENPFPFEWYNLIGKDHFWFQWRLRAARLAIRAAGIPIDRPLRGLEIGGGTGLLRDRLEEYTEWTIDMTDLQLEALKLASRGRGRNLYYDITEERPGFTGAYDVVILFDVLEHIIDTRQFLASLLRHLKPGGVLLLNVPALQMLFSSYDTATGHCRRYNRSSLAAEFDGLAFRIDYLRYWGASLVPLLALRNLVLAARRPKADEIVRIGFEPPSRLTHAGLRALMRVETSIWPAAPVGASLMLVASRTE